MKFVEDVRTLLDRSPDLAGLMGFGHFEDFAQLAGSLFASLCHSPHLGEIVADAYSGDAQLVEISMYDITETARRNFEPGGAPATLLFSRGVQAIMAHRVAHKLWSNGDSNLALGVKATCGRVFATDIHPAAQIGAGLWLDHGLGFVVGETSIIAEDVSIWHNVTLGSTLNDSGPRRHPHVRSGVVIGAGATLLGNIDIGAFSNIAAGALVVEDVPEGRLAKGQKAQIGGKARVHFTDASKVSK